VTLKSFVELAFVGAGLPRLARAAHRRDALVLAYHNVVPDGERLLGDRSLHLPRRAFAGHLDALARSHDIVPLDDIEQPAAGARPRAAITFDDAYRGALTVGLEELARRGLPSTVFVAPGILGDQTLWWDALAGSGAGGLDPALRERALTECRGRGDAVLELASRLGRSTVAVPPWARTATEAELGSAVQAGMRVASHSWSHANLAALAGDELAHEMDAPASWLTQRFAAAYVPYLAYPYGLTSPEAESAAGRAGYRRAFRVSGGYLRSAANEPLACPRLNVPAGISRAGFVLKAAGIRAT